MAKVVVDNPSFMQLFIIGFAAKKEKIKSPQKPNLRGAPLRGACYKRHECSVWDIYCYLRAHFDSWKLIQHRDNWSGSQTEVKSAQTCKSSISSYSVEKIHSILITTYFL